MPVGRSAKKKLRQDKKRQKLNLLLKRDIKQAIKEFKTTPKDNLLVKVFSKLDLAKKRKIFHGNKVARLKSRLAKLLTKKASAQNKKAPTSQKISPRKKKNIV